jgi:hypothetical protein
MLKPSQVRKINLIRMILTKKEKEKTNDRT